MFSFSVNNTLELIGAQLGLVMVDAVRVNVGSVRTPIIIEAKISIAVSFPDRRLRRFGIPLQSSKGIHTGVGSKTSRSNKPVCTVVTLKLLFNRLLNRHYCGPPSWSAVVEGAVIRGI